MDYREMMNKAKEVSKNAYARYSNFPVGACVLAESGKTYVGCNMENASFGLTACAERNAIGAAIANGEKVIKAVAIYSPKTDNCTPCGACRQIIWEFSPKDEYCVVLTEVNGEIVKKTIRELLPDGFVL
ncbi:MAG: cytidine deaminase [Candidatus Melainabacteria bacterium]|nr:MAG: cytidine deaminase [Candidatus Melainabacteria bacterium]